MKKNYYALVEKDFRIQKSMVIFAGLYGALIFTMFTIIGEDMNNHFTFVLAPVAAAWMLLFGSFKGEKNNTGRFVAALPVSRSDIVNGKYIGLAVFAVFGIITTGITGALYHFLFGYPSIVFMSGLDLLRVITGVMLLSFCIPLTFRFGFAAVRTVIIVLLIMGVVAGQVLFFFLNSSGSEDASGGWAVDFLKRIQEVTKIQRNLYLLIFAVVVFVISYFLSKYIYRKKDL